MHIPDIAAEALGWLAFQFTEVQPMLPTYLHLVTSAVLPIYAGAYSSLSRPSSAAKPVKKRDGDDKRLQVEHDDDEEEERHMEGLSPTDAIIFPVMAGCTLAGLYFLIKWLQNLELLNKILNWYFATFSVFSVARLTSDGLDLVHSFLFPRAYVDGGRLFLVMAASKHAVSAVGGQRLTRLTPLPGTLSRVRLPMPVTDLLFWLHVLPSQLVTIKTYVRGTATLRVRFGVHGTVGLLCGVLVVLYYNFVSKPWFLTNLMGFGFAYGALQLLSPTTFWTGTLILSALFFYDIYFVFFTPMMVTVAQSLDIPIKLVFPRPADEDAKPGARAWSMLGLGDVVLPGMMIGLALRFDLYMFYLRKQTRSRAAAKKAVGASEASSEVEIDPKMDETKEREALAKADHKATEQDSIVKVPYVPVSGRWGDWFWTGSMFRRGPESMTPRGLFPKPYFHASIVGYVIGMLTTLAAMHLSHHAQPALLYLVPCVLSSLWLTGWVRGELRSMWDFSEFESDEAVTDKGGDEKDAGGTGNDSKNKAEVDGVDKGKRINKSKQSIFSYARAEERSRRIEASLNKQIQRGAKSSDAHAHVGADEAEDADSALDSEVHSDEDVDENEKEKEENEELEHEDEKGSGSQPGKNKTEQSHSLVQEKGHVHSKRIADSANRKQKAREKRADTGTLLFSFSVRAPPSPFHRQEAPSSTDAEDQDMLDKSHGSDTGGGFVSGNFKVTRVEATASTSLEDEEGDVMREHKDKRLRLR